jgi:hypothetical protein
MIRFGFFFFFFFFRVTGWAIERDFRGKNSIVKGIGIE